MRMDGSLQDRLIPAGAVREHKRSRGLTKTRRGRRNHPDEWTWSTDPAHPAIVTTEEFRQVDAVAAAKARSRRTYAPAQPDPRPAHYLFHGMVRRDCGLRMRGCRRKQTILYYQCQPGRLRGRPLPAGHPSGVYLAEAALLDGVTGFLAIAVYGKERASYWERVLAAADVPDPAAPAAPARQSWSARSPTSRRGSAGGAGAGGRADLGGSATADRRAHRRTPPRPR